jgi:hypothetical protein
MYTINDMIISVLTLILIIILVLSLKQLYNHINGNDLFQPYLSMMEGFRMNDIKWTTDKTCKYKITDTYLDVMKKYNMNNKTNNNDWLLYYPCTYNNINDEINKIEPTNNEQRIFIIDNTDELSGKNNLWNNLVEFYGRDGALKIVPMTYDLNNVTDMELFKKEHDKNKLYIAKKNIQRQEGLMILNNKDKLMTLSKDGYVIIQELLQDPYLVNERKINMRVYVLLTCHNNILSCYIHKNGFMYYTRAPFKKNSEKECYNITTGYIDRWIYKINPLTHNDFKKYLDDDKRELTITEKQLREQNELSKIVFNRIYDIIKRAIMSIEKKVGLSAKLKQNITFQLFGCDIALNDNLEPLIMEFNKGPSIGCFDDKDCQVKQQVISDILKTVGLLENQNNEFIKVI